jgi:putative ATPase
MGLVVAPPAARSFDRGSARGIYPIVKLPYSFYRCQIELTVPLFQGFQLIESRGTLQCQFTCRMPTRMRSLGHGKDYRYPHESPEHFLPQQYLPAELLGTYFYQPSQQGYESTVSDRLARWREAQRLALGISRDETIPDLTEREIKDIKSRHKPSGIV